MKKTIEHIIEWNEICGNNTYDRHLESSMLAEEFGELIIALKNKDRVETVDAVLDLFIIGIGTLHKIGLNAETIDRCMTEILRSNNSKLVGEDGKLFALKDGGGKIVKPEGFSEANLKPIIMNNKL